MSTESARVLKFAKRFNTKPKYLFTHAEIDAISRLWGHTYINHRIKFVIIRLNRFLELGDSKPCDDCQQILDALGITEVYWSNSDKSFRNKYEKVYEVH
jgi:deoxycytidylate deaminase